MDRREAYKEKTEAQLRELEAEIQKLDANVDRLQAEAKLEASRQLETTRAKYDEVQAQLQELKGASEDAWEDVRVGIDGALTELKTSIKLAASKFD